MELENNERTHNIVKFLGQIRLNFSNTISKFLSILLSALTSYNLCFEHKYEKNLSFLSEKKISFLVAKFAVYLNRRVFVMLSNISGIFCYSYLYRNMHVDGLQQNSF